MTENESYFQLVNRRLMSAHFHLAILERSISDTDTLYERMYTQAESRACLEAALLQIYLATFNYINEWLSYYQQPIVTPDNFSIQASLKDRLQVGHCYPELEQLLACFESSNNWLALIDKLPASLCDPSSFIKQAQCSTQKNQKQSLIAVSGSIEESELPDLYSLSTVKYLLSQLQHLIDEQRANQAEY